MKRLFLLFGCAAALAASPVRAADPTSTGDGATAKKQTAAAKKKPVATAAKKTPAASASKKPTATAAKAEPVTKVTGITAAQIADRNVKARGGLKAWQAVQSLRLTGELDVGGTEDPKLPFVLSLKRPHKSRLEITFAGKNAVQVYDGKQGWKLRPFLNRDDVDPFKPDELKSAASSSELDGPLVDYAKKGTRLELVGAEKVEGRKTYKLKLTSKDGTERFLWVDAGTFLETKIAGDPRKLDGRPHDVAIFYRDYRTVSGLKVPYALETVVAGVRGSHKMTFKSVAVNPALDDALFTKPAVALASAPAGPRAP
jgi:outer membrane lipoprotein-sorting protein